MKAIPIRNINQAKEPATGRFSIRKVEDILKGEDMHHELHRHNFFFILIIKSGEGIHEIDFVPYPVMANSVFLLRPGQVHKLFLNAGTTGYLMEFDHEFHHPKEQSAILRLRKASSKNFCQADETHFNRLITLTENIFEECTNKLSSYHDVIRASLEIFFIELVRQSSDPTGLQNNQSSYVQERFEEFTELLAKHIATQKQVSHYSGLMNLSSYQLNEISKTSVGKTASAMIDEYIVLEAKRYLLATPNQVKEIADQLGFEDPSYFIRFFKKHSGVSPDAFRKSLIKSYPTP